MKNNNYNLDRSSGRRRKNLAAALAGLNLRSFAIHTVGDISDEPRRAARAMTGPLWVFSSKLAAIATY